MSLILLLSPVQHLNYKGLFNFYCILECPHLNFLVPFKLKIIIDKKNKENVTGDVSHVKMMMLVSTLFSLLTYSTAKGQL